MAPFPPAMPLVKSNIDVISEIRSKQIVLSDRSNKLIFSAGGQRSRPMDDNRNCMQRPFYHGSLTPPRDQFDQDKRNKRWFKDLS